MKTPGNMILTGADDPSTFSFRDTTPAAAPFTPDPEKQFMADWDAAQARYRAGVNSGYSEKDSEQMYLAPVRNKWEVLKSVPATMRTAAAKELDDAHRAFLVGVNSGYKADDAENIYLKPAEQKWVSAASVTEKKPKSAKDYYESMPAMQDEESDAFKKIAEGQPVRKVIEGHPALLTTPGYNTRWNARYNSALNHDVSTAAEAAKANSAIEAKDKIAQDPEKYLDATAKMAAKFKLPIPAETMAEAQKMLNSRTNFPAIGAQPPVSFQPSAMPDAEPLGVQPDGGNQKYATKYRNPAEVTAAFTGKELTRDEAKKILQDQFGYK